MYVNGGSFIAIGVIFPVLGILATAGRFAARFKRKTGLKADDWLSLPALILLIVCGALLIWGSVNKAVGYHSPPNETLSEALFYESSQMTIILKAEFFVLLFSTVGTGCVRLAILLFYRRLFRGTFFNWVSWILIALTILWTLAFTIGFLAACGNHLPVIWGTAADILTQCMNTLRFNGVQGVTAFALDLVLLSLPFFYKFAVSSIFMVGLFAVGAGAVRMVAAVEVMDYKWGASANILGLEVVNDTMGGISVFLFWVYIEYGVGVIVCSLPSIRGLISGEESTSRIVKSKLPSSSLVASMRQKLAVDTNHSASVSADEDERKGITVTNTVDQYTSSV